MSKIYQTDNPVIGDLQTGDHVRFPNGEVYECRGPVRVKKALGGTALRFVRERRLTARMFSKRLHRLESPDGRAWYEWRYEGAEDS